MKRCFASQVDRALRRSMLVISRLSPALVAIERRSARSTSKPRISFEPLLDADNHP